MQDRPSRAESKYRIDRARIEAAKHGPPELRHQLLDACRRYLLKVANRELDSGLRAKVGASDLVQDSIVVAERDFAKFDGESERALFAWLSKILDHRLKEIVRRYKGTQKRDIANETLLQGSQNLADEIFQPDSTPSAYAIANEEEQRLHEALSRLNERYRRVIYLRNWERMKFEDIGAEFGISADAAGKLWGSAISKLKDELGRSDEPGMR